MKKLTQLPLGHQKVCTYTSLSVTNEIRNDIKSYSKFAIFSELKIEVGWLKKQISQNLKHLGCSLVEIGGFSGKYTKVGSGRPQANDLGCVCDLEKPLA